MQILIQKTQQLILSKKILATSLLVSSLAFADNIGDITEHKGRGGIVRESGEVLATELGVNVMQMDAIETAAAAARTRRPRQQG